MKQACNKCSRTLPLDCFGKDRYIKLNGRMRTCKDCSRAQAVVRPPPCPRLPRSATPCRHCGLQLDHTHYKHTLSWYCNSCVVERKEQARLQLPPAHCDTCGVLTQRFNLLKTCDRCTHCHSVQLAERKRAYFANAHTYSTNAQAQRKRRYRQDPLYRVKDNVVTLIANAFARSGYSKHSRTHNILGCSYSDFCTHIESQFVDHMSWNNRELWHLDHRVPVSLAENEQELLLLNRWENFQPLWAGVNIQKKASVDTHDPLYLELVDLRK